MRTIVIVSITVLFVAGVILWFAAWFSPGSYANAEKYELEVNEQTLIAAVAKFKTEYPDYNVPASLRLEDGKSSRSDHWYHIYFYLKDQDEIVYTWTQPNGTDKTTFALVAFNKGLSLGNWKDINKDFGRLENAAKKEAFENRILNKLKLLAASSSQ